MTQARIFGSDVTEEDLRQMLQGDERLYIEAEMRPPRHAAPVSPENGNEFRLVLSSATAFRIDLARVLTEALSRRVGCAAPCDGLRAALQEALANAILHGNFDLGRWERPEEMVAVGHLITQRLADPRFAARPVVIDARWDDKGIHLSVTDEGRGFDPSARQAASTRAACGRGLTIIAAHALSVEYLDGGNTIAMSFACPGGSLEARG